MSAHPAGNVLDLDYPKTAKVASQRRGVQSPVKAIEGGATPQSPWPLGILKFQPFTLFSPSYPHVSRWYQEIGSTYLHSFRPPEVLFSPLKGHWTESLLDSFQYLLRGTGESRGRTEFAGELDSVFRRNDDQSCLMINSARNGAT